MMTLVLKSPTEVARDIAVQCRTRRLNLNWSQKTLAVRSGVSLGSIKKFEQTGKIALVSLLQLAVTMGVLDSFENLIAEERLRIMPKTTEALSKENTRKRGRG